MKNKMAGRWLLTVMALCLGAGAWWCCAADFTVTPSGNTAYVINTLHNPTLTLSRGVTYVFSVNAFGHSFFIKTNDSANASDQYLNGVTGNGVATGTLTFVVPTDAPNNLLYVCGQHSTAMFGSILVVNPTAPTPRIVFISLTMSNVVVKSTGATNWVVVPEFKSNVTDLAWTTVPGFTNVLANNTNTTTFPRLDVICGSNVVVRIRNHFP